MLLSFSDLAPGQALCSGQRTFTHSVNFTQTQTVFSVVESKQDVAVLRSGPSRTNKHTVLKGSVGFDPQ